MTSVKQAQVELLMKHFMNRVDTAAVFAPSRNPSPAMVVDTVEDLVRAHVIGPDGPEASFILYGYKEHHGHPRVGTYAPAPDGTTRWLCIDFDGAGHSAPLADPLAAAQRVQQIFAEHGLAAYLERSGGGNGWHVWVFFTEPVQASVARTVALALCPDDVPLANGKMADPPRAHGIEVFPKQNKIARGGYGNMVWLPFCWAAAPGCNSFYERGGDGELAVVDVPVIETVAPEHMESLASTLVSQSTSKVASVPAPRTAATLPAKPATDSWKSWRSEVLQRLDLHAVYGQWLTGTSRPGWLECRDPESPTGDRTPSAGVADGAGDAERGRFHSFRSGESLSVFDFLIRRGTAKDMGDACRQVAEWTGCELPTESEMTTDSEDDVEECEEHGESTERHTIVVTGMQHREVVDAAWEAVIQLSVARPFMYVYGDAIVHEDRMTHDLRALDDVGMVRALSYAADWFRKEGKSLNACKPDSSAARDMLRFPDQRLARINQVYRHPVVLPPGRVLAATGYDAETGTMILASPGGELRAMPETVTAEDLRAALELVRQPFKEFPFSRPSDRTHAICALFQSFVRPLYSGPSPIFVIDAPTRGSGKSLLSKVITTIVLGRPGGERVLAGCEDEIRKSITSDLIEGSNVIVFDNIPIGRLVDSASVAAALTTVRWRDRLLGQSRTVNVPNHALWMMTGNNVRLSDELARRAVHIRLDPGVERPEERAFEIADLATWVTVNRAELIRAILVLVRAWVAAGSPGTEQRFGSFESWANVVGGIVEFLKFEGFLQDREALHEETDDAGDWIRLVEFCRARKMTDLQVESALSICQELGLFAERLRDGNERGLVTRMGLLLSGVRDRVFAGAKFERIRDPGRRGPATYRLVTVRDVGTEVRDDCGTLGEQPTAP